MSRELRRVPADWNPPRLHGRYQPHFDIDFRTACREWKKGFVAWEKEPESDCEYWEFYGDPPDRDYCRPEWADEERTHFMLYETTSEGTPLSPAFPSIEELSRWLADNNVSASGGRSATYDEWLSMCKVGGALTDVFTRDGFVTGVSYISREAGK